MPHLPIVHGSPEQRACENSFLVFRVSVMEPRKETDSNIKVEKETHTQGTHGACTSLHSCTEALG